MKKTILIFGVISGVISSVLMCATLPFLSDLNHGDKGLIVGYTGIVLSFLMVYFGIRSYRDNVAGGAIGFGRGFAIGMAITLISCVFYVVTWEILYFNFMHGFMDSYFTAQIHKVQSGPGTAEAIQAKVAAIRESQRLYENPLVNAAYTFIEPFPVGLVITLVSAAVLRRSRKVRRFGRRPRTRSEAVPEPEFEGAKGVYPGLKPILLAGWMFGLKPEPTPNAR